MSFTPPAGVRRAEFAISGEVATFKIAGYYVDVDDATVANLFTTSGQIININGRLMSGATTPARHIGGPQALVALRFYHRMNVSRSPPTPPTPPLGHALGTPVPPFHPPFPARSLSSRRQDYDGRRCVCHL